MGERGSLASLALIFSFRVIVFWGEKLLLNEARLHAWTDGWDQLDSHISYLFFLSQLVAEWQTATAALFSHEGNLTVLQHLVQTNGASVEEKKLHRVMDFCTLYRRVVLEL